MRNKLSHAHLKLRTHDQAVSLDKFYLLLCTAQIDMFFFDDFPCSKVGMTSSWTRLGRVKGKLVKENLVVCTGLHLWPVIKRYFYCYGDYTKTIALYCDQLSLNIYCIYISYILREYWSMARRYEFCSSSNNNIENKRYYYCMFYYICILIGCWHTDNSW